MTRAVPLILVADDDPSFLEVAEAKLKSQGFDIKTAHDGAQAIATAKDLQPDLILMDVQMPNMDGIEAASRLQQDPDTKNIRVLFLTNLGDPSPMSIALNRRFSREVGAADYFKKSGDYDHLVARIQDILAKQPTANIQTSN